ncbi:MAG: hypothetical protein KDD70_06375 [Bdellovibrionales bacterium]|nr:hypothetical protein [Bdellovibrionales bacterium]
MLPHGSDNVPATNSEQGGTQNLTGSLKQYTAHNEFGPLPPRKEQCDWTIKILRTGTQLSRLVELASKRDEFSFDTETYGLDGEPINARLGVIQIGLPKLDKAGNYVTGKGTAYLVLVRPLEARAERESVNQHTMVNPLEPLRALMENPEIIKIGQSLSFDRGQMEAFGIEMENEGEVDEHAPYGLKFRGVADTRTLMRTYRPSLDKCRTLAAITVENLGYSLSKAAQTSDWGQDQLDDGQIHYAALDVQAAYEAKKHLVKNVAAHTKVDLNSTPHELAAIIVRSHHGQIDLIRPIGEQLAIYDQRIENTKQAIRNVLSERFGETDSAVEFASEEYGSAKLKIREKKELDLDELFKRVPAIAADPEVVRETAKQTDIKEALLERHGGAKSLVDADISQLFEKTERKGPSLSIDLHLDHHYSQNLELPTFCSEWSTHSISTAEMGEALADTLATRKCITLQTVKGASGRTNVALEIGIHTGNETELQKGMSITLPLQVLGEMQEENSRFYQALKGLFQRSEPAVVVFDKGQLGKIAEKYGLTEKHEEGEEKHTPFRTLSNEVARFVPQLHWPIRAVSLTSAAGELLGVVPSKEDDRTSSELCFRLAKRLGELADTSAPPLPPEEFSADEKIEFYLRSILQDEAKRLLTLRPLGEHWDIERVRELNAQEALKRVLIDQHASAGSSEKKHSVQTENGTVSITYRDEKILDVQLLKEMYPDIADKVLRHEVNREKLRDRLEQNGSAYRREMEEQITKATGETEIRISVNPRYKHIYLAEE